MKKAFTLLELIISLAIVSLLVILINSIFVMNFKISNKIIIDNDSYKESTNTMLYIENKIRRADKIEIRDEDNPVCNFVIYIGNSKYYFYKGLDNKILIKTKNENTGSNWIGKAKDMKLTYDNKDKVSLWLEGINGEIYKTSIHLQKQNEK